MKYLGEKSLSTVVEKLLHASWYLVLVGSVFVALILSILLFSTPNSNSSPDEFHQVKSQIVEKFKSDNPREWKEFQNIPPVGKGLVIPYFVMLVAFLLQILRRGRYIFNNFKQNLVFTEGNVQTISQTSKLLIWFSILSFNFVLLIVSVILLILSDVFKNGVVLQEEHDLTV